jgi:hypothetical protein
VAPEPKKEAILPQRRVPVLGARPLNEAGRMSLANGARLMAGGVVR